MAETVGEVKRIPAAVCEFEWSIPEFSADIFSESDAFFQRKFQHYGSPCFEILEEDSCLSITFDVLKRFSSITQKRTLEYFDIGLSIDFFQKPPVQLEVSFAIKNADGNKDKERHNPCQLLSTDEIEYVVYRYISRAELLKRASELMPSGTLTVICTVKYTESIGGNVMLSRRTSSRGLKRPMSQGLGQLPPAKKPLKSSRESRIETSECAHCKYILDAKAISFHEKNCYDNPAKCLDCSNYVNLNESRCHECQSKKEGETESAKCTHCQEFVDAETISHHEKKCLNRPIRCPDCSEVVTLKNWQDHECHTTKLEGEPCTSGINIQYQKVLHDFKQLFRKKENCDVVLRVKGEEFTAHKIILEARSSIFASTFRSDVKERSTGVVEIDDCEPTCFSDFLCFLYSGDVDISKDSVFSLFRVADKYDVQDLRVKCLAYVKENLSVDTFCDTLTLALLHSETDLVKLSTHFFTKNAPKIILTVKWQMFLKENPTQSNELLIKLLVPDESSNK